MSNRRVGYMFLRLARNPSVHQKKKNSPCVLSSSTQLFLLFFHALIAMHLSAMPHWCYFRSTSTSLSSYDTSTYSPHRATTSPRSTLIFIACTSPATEPPHRWQKSASKGQNMVLCSGSWYIHGADEGVVKENFKWSANQRTIWNKSVDDHCVLYLWIKR